MISEAKKQQMKAELDATSTMEIVHAINRIDRGMKAVNSAGLKRDAIVILIQSQTDLTRKEILQVLDVLSSLGKRFLSEKAIKN